MSVAEKVLALLDSMTVASLDQLVPTRRRHFADLMRHWAKLAETDRIGVTPPPKIGVLADIKDGHPRHGG